MVRPARAPNEYPRLIQSGGVVGGRRVWTLGPKDLDPAARRHLQKAPTKKSGGASPALSHSSRTAGGRRATETPAVRDFLVYSFVLKRSRRVTFRDSALPPSLRTLVARVTRRPPDREGDSAWA